jgi:hypothetical protein
MLGEEISGKERLNESRGRCIQLIYEHGTVKPTEVILRSREVDERERCYRKI